jgi:hypothetical protein
VQADTDFVGSQPCPLQLFCPLQSLLALLQALVPLQELMPTHMTVFVAAFAGAEATVAPPIARTTAAAAMLLPETKFIFIVISPEKEMLPFGSTSRAPSPE